MKLPAINPAEILDIIEDELRQASLSGGPHRGRYGGAGQPNEADVTPVDLHPPFLPTEAPSLKPRAVYDLNEFLAYHDEAFIRNAYRGILKRHPDQVGLAHYLNALRSGKRSKVEILGRLRFSPEGRCKAVPIKGLLLPFVVETGYHFPGLGYLLRWFLGLVRLPWILSNWQRFESFSHERFHELARSQREAHKQLAGKINELVAVQGALGAQLRALKRQLAQLEQASRMHDPDGDAAGPRNDDGAPPCTP